MGDKESELAIYCIQARLPVVGLGCIQVSCWLSRSHGDPQTTQADDRTKGHSWQTYIWGQHCWGQFYKAHWRWRGAAGECMEPSTLHLSLCGVRKYSAVTKGEMWTSTHLQNYDLRSILPTVYAWAMLAQILWEWTINFWFNLRSTPQEESHAWHCLNDQEPEWIAQRPRVEQNTTTIKNSMKLFLMIVFYTHRSIPCPVVIRDASHVSRQRLTTRQYADRD